MRTIIFAASLSFAAHAQPPESVSMRIDPVAHSETYSGRVYLVAMPTGRPGDPIDGMHSWFNAIPVASWDVEDVNAGEGFSVNGFDRIHMADQYSEDWGEGDWTVQAVARVNLDAANAGQGAGDLFSDPVEVTFGEPWPEFVLSNTVPEQVFQESDTLKHFSIRSPRLSAFHGRDITMHAGVRLPDSWGDDPDRRYPVVYIVTGFGGSHHQINRYMRMVGGDDAIIVVPDATNHWGHSVFANSEVIGPWGDAFVFELAPALEAVFRGPTSPEHRYVTGVSSGGWSSLWLQIAYPTEFGGCWSHAPDPVDFRAFQTVDIYSPEANIYTDAEQERRPLARNNGEILLYADGFIGRETVLGPGGQIQSFEAVFSPAEPNGDPLPLFDRETGEISSQTAETWKPYDIRLKMAEEWEANKQDLAGKIRVYGGEIDNFYLGESVELLRAQLEEIGVELGSMDQPGSMSQADVRVIPGMTHTLYRAGNEAMWRTIRERWEARAEQIR